MAYPTLIPALGKLVQHAESELALLFVDLKS